MKKAPSLTQRFFLEHQLTSFINPLFLSLFEKYEAAENHNERRPALGRNQMTQYIMQDAARFKVFNLI